MSGIVRLLVFFCLYFDRTVDRDEKLEERGSDTGLLH